MFSDANLPEPLVISEIENPVRLVEIRKEDGIFFNSRFTDIRLIRAYIYDLLKKSRRKPAAGLSFCRLRSLPPHVGTNKALGFGCCGTEKETSTAAG